jgi:hypothetical protein
MAAPDLRNPRARRRDVGAHAPAQALRERLGELLDDWWNAVLLEAYTCRTGASLLNLRIDPCLGPARSP